jgi:hypothetical protein
LRQSRKDDVRDAVGLGEGGGERLPAGQPAVQVLDGGEQKVRLPFGAGQRGEEGEGARVAADPVRDLLVDGGASGGPGPGEPAVHRGDPVGGHLPMLGIADDAGRTDGYLPRMGSVKYLFSVVPVADRAAGRNWFEAFFGRPADEIVGDEALWQVGDAAWVVVDEHVKRAGGAMLTLGVEGSTSFSPASPPTASSTSRSRPTT